MRKTDQRFEKFAKRFGMVVGKKYTSPRDMKPILYRRLRLFNVSAKMNAFPKEEYRYQTVNMTQRNLHECKFRVRMEWYKVKTSLWFMETVKEWANQKFNPHEYEI